MTRQSISLSCLIAMALFAVVAGADDGVESSADTQERSVGDDVQLLSAAGMESITIQARLHEPGRFAPAEGQWREPTDGGPDNEEYLLYVVSTEPLRVMQCEYNICTLVYIDEESLADVTVRPTRLVEADRAFVEVAPGVVLDLSASPGDAAEPVEAQVKTATFETRGQVDPADLGTIFEPIPYFEPDIDHKLVESADVLATPGGDTIATIPDDAWLPAIGVRRLSPATDGYVEIMATTADARIRGWVDAAVIEPSEPYGVVFGTGTGGWGCSHCDTREIPGETHLYLEPDGAPVAHTLSTTSIALEERDDDGWYRVRYPTAWGMVSAWLPPDTEL